MELLGVGEIRRARQAFASACRDGGSYSRALMRLALGYSTWRFGARFPGLIRRLARAVASLRGQTNDGARVRLPGAWHDMSRRPSQLIGKVANVLAWFERYRSGATASPEQARR